MRGLEASPPAMIVLWLCLSVVLIKLLWGVLNLISNFLFIRVGLQAMLKLRTDLYSCLQALPLRFHDARRSADSSYRVAYDSQSIQTIYNKGFATILQALVTLVGAMGVMFTINWRLTLASMVVLPSSISRFGIMPIASGANPRPFTRARATCSPSRRKG